MPENLWLQSDVFNPPPPQIEITQRDDDQRMPDFFTGDEFRNLLHRHEPRRQILALIPFHLVFQPAVFNQDGVGFVA